MSQELFASVVRMEMARMAGEDFFVNEERIPAFTEMLTELNKKVLASKVKSQLILAIRGDLTVESKIKEVLGTTLNQPVPDEFFFQGKNRFGTTYSDVFMFPFNYLRGGKSMEQLTAPAGPMAPGQKDLGVRDESTWSPARKRLEGLFKAASVVEAKVVLDREGDKYMSMLRALKDIRLDGPSSPGGFRRGS